MAASSVASRGRHATYSIWLSAVMYAQPHRRNNMGYSAMFTLAFIHRKFEGSIDLVVDSAVYIVKYFTVLEGDCSRGCLFFT